MNISSSGWMGVAQQSCMIRRGAYVWVGDADEVMTPYELYSYEAFRNHIKDDIRIVENPHLELYDRGLIERSGAEWDNDRRLGF